MPEKQVINPIITCQAKGIPQFKPRIGQGRAGLRWKIKTLMSPLFNKPIVKLSEKPVEQPKVTSKVQIPEGLPIHDKIIPTPYYAIPQTRSGDDSSSRMVKRKTTPYISWEIPRYPDPIYRLPP